MDTWIPPLDTCCHARRATTSAADSSTASDSVQIPFRRPGLQLNTTQHNSTTEEASKTCSKLPSPSPQRQRPVPTQTVATAAQGSPMYRDQPFSPTSFRGSGYAHYLPLAGRFCSTTLSDSCCLPSTSLLFPPPAYLLFSTFSTFFFSFLSRSSIPAQCRVAARV